MRSGLTSLSPLTKMTHEGRCFVERPPMSIAETLATKRDEILRVASRHKASNVRVFGSIARGEARLESDVDFLVEFEPRSTLLDHAALVRELRDLIGSEVDVVSDEGLRPRMRDRVLREAVPL